MAKLGAFGKAVESWQKPRTPGAAPFGLRRQNQIRNSLFYTGLPGFHIVWVRTRPRNGQSCPPSPGNTAEVAGMPKLATAGEGVRTGDCMLAPGRAKGARP